MTSASRNATVPVPVGKLTGGIAAGVAALASWARTRLQRRECAQELRALTDDQLRDVGIDRAAIEPARPVLEIEGSLMRRLTSMS